MLLCGFDPQAGGSSWKLLIRGWLLQDGGGKEPERSEIPISGVLMRCIDGGWYLHLLPREYNRLNELPAISAAVYRLCIVPVK